MASSQATRQESLPGEPARRTPVLADCGNGAMTETGRGVVAVGARLKLQGKPNCCILIAQHGGYSPAAFVRLTRKRSRRRW